MKEANLHFMTRCMCFFFLDGFNGSGPSIYSKEMKNGSWMVKNGGRDFLVRTVDENGRRRMGTLG